MNVRAPLLSALERRRDSQLLKLCGAPLPPLHGEGVAAGDGWGPSRSGGASGDGDLSRAARPPSGRFATTSPMKGEECAPHGRDS